MPIIQSLMIFIVSIFYACYSEFGDIHCEFIFILQSLFESFVIFFLLPQLFRVCLVIFVDDLFLYCTYGL